MTIVFVFKNGYELPIKCDGYSLQRDSDGKIAEINLEGKCDVQVLGVDSSEIMCVFKITGTEANTPPTNGDCIRTMDNKELSEYLCSIMTSECCDRTCPGREFCELGHKGLLDWLQATHKEEV